MYVIYVYADVTCVFNLMYASRSLDVLAKVSSSSLDVKAKESSSTLDERNKAILNKCNEFKS